LVNWKKSHSRTTLAIATPIVPRSWSENETPPRWMGRVGNALGNALISGDQIHPLEQDQQPDRHDHDRDDTCALDGLDRDAVDEDPTDECHRERQEERTPVADAPLHQLPRDVRREHRHLSLREVDDVGRAVDENERERETAEDAAAREPRDRLLGELVADEAADEQRDARGREQQEDRRRRGRAQYAWDRNACGFHQ
jgi:hypothetical protein